MRLRCACGTSRRIPVRRTCRADGGRSRRARLDDWECSALVAATTKLEELARTPGYFMRWSRSPLRCAEARAHRYPELLPDNTFSPLQGHWSVWYWNLRGDGVQATIHAPSGTLEIWPMHNEFDEPIDRLCPGQPVSNE